MTHYQRKVADSRVRQNAALLKCNLQAKKQRAAANKLWGDFCASKGEWEPADAVFIAKVIAAAYGSLPCPCLPSCKVSHWHNSCLHVGQTKGGHIIQGSFASITNCQKSLRYKLARLYGYGNTKHRNVWIMFCAANLPSFRSLPGHKCKEWSERTAGKILGVAKVDCIMEPGRFKQQFPRRADVFPINAWSGKASNVAGRFKTVPRSTRQAPVVISKVYRSFGVTEGEPVPLRSELLDVLQQSKRNQVVQITEPSLLEMAIDCTWSAWAA